MITPPVPTAWRADIDAGTQKGIRYLHAIERAGISTDSDIVLPDPHQRPGTVLQGLLKTRYELAIASCRCQEWIDRMNAWGIDGCRAHVAEIVDHLFEEASTNSQVSLSIRAALNVPVIGRIEGKRRISNLVIEAILMAETAPHSGMTQDALAIRLQAAAADWPAGWHDWANVIEYHRDLVQAAIAVSKAESRKPKAESQKPSRAILIPAGGMCRIYDAAHPVPYFWCAYAAAYTLRFHGCELPIEFWFLPGEVEQVEHCELYARRVAATVHTLETSDMRCVHGWQVKINAILQSTADQVMHIDADNIVARDPSFLFDCQEFQDNAALFWGDNPGLKDHRGYVGPKQWERLGSDRRDTIRDIEAGQMLIDKRRGAAALQVVKHLADHADYWGGFNGGSPGIWYGDKTDFHVGFALTETPHWINQGFKWNPGGFYEHRSPGGDLVFQHACHRKGHIVNGHRIQNLKGNEILWEANRFRTPLTFVDGSVKDAQRLISPEKHFAIPDDRSMSRTVWLDVLARNEYQLPPAFHAGDTILDIGGNSGAFAYACLRRGAGRVVSVEPFPASAEGLRANCEDMADRLTVIEAAVWRSDLPPGTIPLHPHDGADRSTSYSVTLSQDGRSAWPVPTIALDYMLLGLGEVHILKLDCEGSEWPILYTSEELRRCEHIIGEYHQDALPLLGGDPPAGGWPDWTLSGLIEFLQANGFEVHRIETNSAVHGGFWAKRR